MIAGIKSKPYKITIEPAVKNNIPVSKPVETNSPENSFNFKDNGNAQKSRLYNESRSKSFTLKDDSVTAEEVKRGKGRGAAEVKYVGNYVVVPKDSVPDTYNDGHYTIGRIVDGKLKVLYGLEKTTIIGELVNLLF